MANKFNPTKEQINAAQTLAFAKAFYSLIQPIYENLETSILASGNYHYHERYFTPEYLERRGECERFPSDRMLHNRKHLHMIAGLDEACKDLENDNGDAARFYRELRVQTKLAGLIHGESAECKASNEVHEAERNLINITHPIHNITADQVSGSLDNWKKLVDLTMGLLSHWVKGGITPELVAYQDARMITSLYYYEAPDRTRVSCDKLPANTYALAGIQDDSDTGKLTVRTQAGLTPLLDGITHRQVSMPQYAGKTFDGIQWYVQ
jgi:hypothetical protein